MATPALSSNSQFSETTQGTTAAKFWNFELNKIVRAEQPHDK